MTGRRGALICALGAIDMALWDIRGQAVGQPIYKLLGGSAARPVVPYASLLPTGDTVDAQCAVAGRQESLGPIAGLSRRQARSLHQRPVQPQRPASGRPRGGRDRGRLPPGRGARLHTDGRRGLRLAQRASTRWAFWSSLRPYDLFFVETPIDIDDLDGYALLHAHSPIRIAAGEWQNTHWEFLDLADRGQLDVLQPDVGRVGGFSEAHQGLPHRRGARAADRAALLEKRDRHRRQRPPGRRDVSLSLY